MPSEQTRKRAKRDLAQGKSASTAAGEFIREEMHHIREGKHGAKNAKQAIAIGLSKARRAGVPAQPGKAASKRTRKKAAQDIAHAGKPKSPRRARAAKAAQKRQPRAAASHRALSRQARASAERRRKAGGPRSPKAVAQRAARTRKRHAGKRTRRAAG
jgi:hypothetical protein